MKIFTSSRQAKSFCKKGTCLTLGNYDGVHLGHQSILKNLVKEGLKRRLPSVVYTFMPHPVKMLAPHIAPLLITTLEQKLELLSNTGVSAVIVEKFDKTFSQQSAESFFYDILIKRLNARFITVGYDFTFGKKREGNIETLEILCYKNGIDDVIVKPVLKSKMLVSSTLIRKRLMAGEITESNQLLGHPFNITGRITKGEGRGKSLGWPTINLLTENELIPPHGVYATQTEIAGTTYKSLTNIGVNPTFYGATRKIETHLLNCKRNLYGKKAQIYFLKFLRDEKKFTSPNKLALQIKKDVQNRLKLKT